MKRDLGWPRKEKLVLKKFFFAIGRYNEKMEGDVLGLLEIDVFPRKRYET